MEGIDRSKCLAHNLEVEAGIHEIITEIIALKETQFLQENLL